MHQNKRVGEKNLDVRVNSMALTIRDKICKMGLRLGPFLTKVGSGPHWT